MSGLSSPVVDDNSIANNWPAMDNFCVGAAATGTPEPASLLLLGAGLLALAGFR